MTALIILVCLGTPLYTVACAALIHYGDRLVAHLRTRSNA